ncbi:HAD family hydrolase [Corynebacterium sp. AOP40-9SA-29]|uniref:HAD family hydrolase n=1 Tax=Corynebacterium sp. AOP40-9SA-29 TaxID=3457677 RepID=UPI00403490B4
MKKLAAFDFDGTILFDDGVHPDTCRAIRAWQDAGHLAVAATGKSLSAARYALQDVDIAFDYAVLFTGSVVTGPGWDVLHHTPLPSESVRPLVEMLAGVEGIAVYGTMLHGRDVRFSTTIPDDPGTTILRDFREMGFDEIDDHEFIGVPVRVPGNEELKLELVARIREAVGSGGASGAVGADCVVNQNFIDVIPAGTTKQAGLDWLTGHLGVAREELEVHTFGDSFNDLPMHAGADHSYSLPWSPDEVKNATDEVIDSVAGTLHRLLAEDDPTPR